MSPRLQRVLNAARTFYLEHAAEHGIDPAPEVWCSRTLKRGRSTLVYHWLVDQREDEEANPGPRVCIRVHRGAERLEWVASRSREEAAAPIPEPEAGA